MKKISFRFVYNRKKSLNRDGKALIQVEAYMDRKTIYMSTHLYIEPQYWNDKKKCIVRHPQRDKLNRYLSNFMLELENKEYQLWKQDSLTDINSFRQYISPSNEDIPSFYILGRKWVEQSVRTKSTKSNILTTLNLLKENFPQLKFTDLDYHFLRKWEHILYTKGLKMNTVAKHMKHLKTLVNESIRNGYMRESPFSHYTIRCEESHHVFLLPQELTLLEDMANTLHNQTHKHILHAFLFCCYTGLRYSDFISLKAQNIHKLENMEWLEFVSQKTTITIRLPLFLLFNGKPLSILKNYTDIDTFFSIPSNSQVDKVLMKLGKAANIEKHFSFHSARHTNATLLIYKGVNITTVQKLLGHKSIKTTQIYSDIFADTIVNDLTRSNNKV